MTNKKKCAESISGEKERSKTTSFDSSEVAGMSRLLHEIEQARLSARRINESAGAFHNAFFVCPCCGGRFPKIEKNEEEPTK